MKDKSKVNTKIIAELSDTISVLSDALVEEVDKKVLGDAFEDAIDESPSDISARYWLIQFLEPLSKKQLKSIVDGFLIQLLDHDQAKKLVKFLLTRFPQYYSEDMAETIAPEQHTDDEDEDAEPIRPEEPTTYPEDCPR